MPRYLISATGFRKTENDAYSPRSFTFEVLTDRNWSARNSEPVRNLAFHEYHKAFGHWPSQPPQIDSVDKIDTKASLPEEMLAQLGLIGSMTEQEKDALLRDIILLVTQETEGPADADTLDEDDLI